MGLTSLVSKLGKGLAFSGLIALASSCSTIDKTLYNATKVVFSPLDLAINGNVDSTLGDLENPLSDGDAQAPILSQFSGISNSSDSYADKERSTYSDSSSSTPQPAATKKRRIKWNEPFFKLDNGNYIPEFELKEELPMESQFHRTKEDLYAFVNPAIYNYEDIITRRVKVGGQESDSDLWLFGSLALNLLTINAPVNNAEELRRVRAVESASDAAGTKAVIEGQKEAAQIGREEYQVIPGKVPVGRNGMCVLRYPNGDDAWFYVAKRDFIDVTHDGLTYPFEVQGVTDTISINRDPCFIFMSILPGKKLPGDAQANNYIVRIYNTQTKTIEGEQEGSGMRMAIPDSHKQDFPRGDYIALWQKPDKTILASIPFRVID